MYLRYWWSDSHTHRWTNSTKSLYKVACLCSITFKIHYEPISQVDACDKLLASHVPRPVGILLFVGELEKIKQCNENNGGRTTESRAKIWPQKNAFAPPPPPDHTPFMILLF